MAEVKLTSDKGEVLFAKVDEDGDYYIKTLDTYVIANQLESGDYPGWSVEKVIELPTKDWALVVPTELNIGFVPYVLYPGIGWTCGNDIDGEPELSSETEVLEFLNDGWIVAFEGVEA